MRLEVGKRYITRSGKVTEKLEKMDEGDLFMAKVTDDPHHIRNWNLNGTHAHERSEFDLVQEYLEPFKPDDVGKRGVKPIKLEEGKRYVTRCGKVTEKLVFANTFTDINTFSGSVISDTSKVRNWFSNGVHAYGNKDVDIIREYEPLKSDDRPEIILEVGKRYVTRSGQVTDKLQYQSMNNGVEFIAQVGDQGLGCWYPNGDNGYGSSSFDIFSEYSEKELTNEASPCTIQENDANNTLTSKELNMKNSPYDVLTAQIEKNEKARVASYAVKVANVRSKAEERMIQAQKELRAAEKLVNKQKNALKKFKKSGNTKHLSIFGV